MAHAELEGDRCGISLEKGMERHSNSLAWRISWTRIGELVRLSEAERAQLKRLVSYSPWDHKESDTTE